MHPTSLTGQVALVTAGTRGIGYAAAHALASQGATVVISSRSAPPDEAVIGTGRISGIVADSSQIADLERLVQTTLDQFGRIDILINNAGAVPYIGPTLDASLADWDATFAVNVRGTFALTREVVRAWMGARGGVIVNVASTAGLRAGGLGVYGITKATLLMLTKQLASELGPKGIRVNAVAPGLIQTDFSAALWGNPAVLERVTANNPSRRIGRAEEVGQAIAFLASPAASYINGEILVIDGGTLA